MDTMDRVLNNLVIQYGKHTTERAERRAQIKQAWHNATKDEPSISYTINWHEILIERAGLEVDVETLELGLLAVRDALQEGISTPDFEYYLEICYYKVLRGAK